MNKYEYTPWGETVTAVEGVAQPLRYTAREWDAESQLYFYRARYYDPKLGRFLSEDPLGVAGGLNAVAYVGGDPVNARDPSGTCSEGSRLMAMVLYTYETGSRRIVDSEVLYFFCSGGGGLGGLGWGGGGGGEGGAGLSSGVCPEVTYVFNPVTGKYDVTLSVNMVFNNGSAADATFVQNSIRQFWSGVHGIWNVTIDLSDTSAPTYDVTFGADFDAHGEGRSFGPGRGGYMKLWAPGGLASGAGSNLTAHEFGHASGFGRHLPGPSLMNNPPGSYVDATLIGALVDRCEGRRTDGPQ